MKYTYTLCINGSWEDLQNLRLLGYTVIHFHGLGNSEFEIEIWLPD